MIEALNLGEQIALCRVSIQIGGTEVTQAFTFRVQVERRGPLTELPDEVFRRQFRYCLGKAVDTLERRYLYGNLGLLRDPAMPPAEPEP